MTLSIEKKTDHVLRTAMRGNAIFSTGSGLFLAAAATMVAGLIGVEPPAVLRWLGVILIIYGLDLFWITSRPEVGRHWGLAAVALDVLWVAGSAVLVLTDLVPLTTAGIWAVIIVADIVALFAIWQGYGVWRLNQA